MKSLKLFFIANLICLGAQNVALSEDFFSLEDIEQSENFGTDEFDDIENLQEKIKENNNTKIPVKFKEVKKDKYVPPVFRALLKRGSELTDVQTGKTLRVAREIFVKAQQQIFGDSYTYILNQAGEWIYRTRTLNLASIEDDMTFGLDKIDPNETWQKSYRYNMENKHILIDQRLTIALESMQADLYSDLFNEETTADSSATRIDWRIFYSWQLPVQFGLSAAYQDGRYNLGQISWKSISFGPLVRYDLANLRENIKLKVSSGVQKSAFYNANISGKNFALTTLTWHLDLESVIYSEWGNWIFGLEYRVQTSGVIDDPDNIVVDDNDKDTIKSLGFVFGREFNFIL